MQNHNQPLNPLGLSSSDSTDGSTPPTDIHDLLRTPRRWYAIEYLARTRQPVEFNQLVDYVVDRLGEDRKSVRNTMYQTHLPKLASAEAVDYEKPSGEVAPGPRLHEVTDHMTGVDASPGLLARLRRWLAE